MIFLQMQFNQCLYQILNAHMDSLQWIDSNAQGVERKLQEVSRLADIHRRDSERLQRSMLD